MEISDMKRAILPDILRKLIGEGIVTAKLHDDGKVWFRITEFEETTDVEKARKLWEEFKPRIRIDIKE